MRSARDFFKPLAVGAPNPVMEIPFRPSRMIHFLDPSNERMVEKAPGIAQKTDILLGNLEDAIQIKNKEAAREGFIKMANSLGDVDCQLWTRVNSLDSPWILDDLERIITEVGDKVDVIMIPKVEGPWNIHFVDQYMSLLEARAGIKKPILIHAILETALGVANVEEIAMASPRMQGMSLGPADLAASRRMKTTRVGGGHPGYLVRNDPDPSNPDAPRATAQQDLWHYTIARMVDACNAAGILPFYGPFGDIKDVVARSEEHTSELQSRGPPPSPTRRSSDLRRMKTTRVGGGHPGYLVRNDPDPSNPDAPRATAQQDLWHYTIARMVDACNAAGILPFYGPFGDIKDVVACEDQFRNAFLLGCARAWSLHPVQIGIAKKVFSPPVEEVKWALRVIEEMGDGAGAVMIDGKMQDDATYKQCKVMVELAEALTANDPELKEAYGL